MDTFLSNLYDVQERFDASALVTGISHQTLMTDTRLQRNAAFRFAWQTLSGGALPSARCYSEFITARGGEGCFDLQILVNWLLGDTSGPFFLIRDTVVMKARLVSLCDSNMFHAYVESLKKVTVPSVLHRSLVVKLIDRFPSCPSASTIDIGVAMQMSLLKLYKKLAEEERSDIPLDPYVNPVSGKRASIHEEESDRANTCLCSAPVVTNPTDAIKRRFARDLHFLKLHFGRPLVVAHASVMQHGEIVRIAVGSPWVVEQRAAMQVMKHVPVISSSLLHLHVYGSEICPQFPTTGSSDREDPSLGSVLIVFHAPTCVPDKELATLGHLHGYRRILRAFVHDIEADSRVSIGVTTEPRDIVYPVFFGKDGMMDWTHALLASTLKNHVRVPDPFSTSVPYHSCVLVDRCLTYIALVRGLLDGRVRFEVSPPQQQKNVVLAVDSRQDAAATVLSIVIALSSLRSTSGWGVRVMCSKRNRHDMERMLLPMCPNACFDDTAQHLNSPPGSFEVETNYNNLMKDPTTWRSLLPAKMALTVQDDGILIRRGLERLDGGAVMEGGLPYLGAPWQDVDANAHLKLAVPSMVGNGGLSIRNVSDMICVSTSIPCSARDRLFHNRIEPVPEDVMFAMLLNGEKDSPLRTRHLHEVAQAFACEMVPFTKALGFHKPWPYWPVNTTFLHMESILHDEMLQDRSEPTT